MEALEDAIKTLNALIRLDVDAVSAYSQAIDNIHDAEVRSRLVSFRADHERHMTELAAEVDALGGSPPKISPDVKGYLLEGFTAIRSLTGIEGALKAMKVNEALTNRQYQRSLERNLPDRARSIVRRNYEDEQRHLRYVEQVLQDRPWIGEPRKAG